MNLKILQKIQNISSDKNLMKTYSQFELLISELGKKTLNQDVESFINTRIEELNASTLSGAPLTKLIKKKQAEILKKVEKDHKIVPKNYYRSIWMLLGMTGFGLPLGVAFGLSLGNLGLLGAGLPIGMVFGIAIGTSMDNKAFNEGRQIDLEVKK